MHFSAFEELQSYMMKHQTCQPEGQEIREANRPGVVGASHAPNRVRGDAPVGAQGAKPPEAPGFMRILK